MWRAGIIAAALPFMATAQVIGQVDAMNTGVLLSCPLENNLTCSAGRSATIVRASSAFCLQSDNQYTEATSGNACFGVDGLSIWESVANLVTDSLDASAHTEIGTSVVTVDQGSGPFATYSGGAEADQLDDDDGTNYEGVSFTSLGTGSDDYVFWAYFDDVSAFNDITLQLFADSSNTGQCTITDFDSSPTITPSGSATCGCTDIGDWTRCYITDNETPATDMVPRVLVGDANTDTGAVLISGAHGLKGETEPLRPCPSGASPATCAADVVSLATDGIPVSAGSLRFDYTPDIDPDGTFNILDARAAGSNGWALFYLGGTNQWRFDRDSDTGTPHTSAIAAGTTISMCVDWNPDLAVVYEDASQFTPDTDTDAVGSVVSEMHIGSRSFSTALNFANGSIKNLRFGTGGCP